MRVLGVLALALVIMAAMSEGAVSRDFVAALAISISAAAMIAAALAYRHSMIMLRKAQDYFAELDAAARRMARANLEKPHLTEIAVQAAPRRQTSSGKKRAIPVAANSAAPGPRPLAADGGKSIAEIRSSEAAAAEDALHLALDTHDLSISLEPIVELGSSKVIAYRVHAHLKTAEGADADIRRLEGKHTGIDPAKFDMDLFHAAASAMRRFFGGTADDTPLICPVSAATLSSHKDLRKIVGMITGLPGLQTGLMMEIPAEALQREGIAATGAALLSDAAIRLAIEGPMPSEMRAEIFERFAFEFWSLKGAFISMPGSDATGGEQGNSQGTRLVATHLAEDHDVIAMIDAGVKLVCGPLFSQPKPVKPRGADAALPGEKERKGGHS